MSNPAVLPSYVNLSTAGDTQAKAAIVAIIGAVGGPTDTDTIIVQTALLSSEVDRLCQELVVASTLVIVQNNSVNTSGGIKYNLA
jgi:hypothetical protein